MTTSRAAVEHRVTDRAGAEPGDDVRVLVVDDDAVVQRITAVMLEGSDGLSLAGQAWDGRSALHWLATHDAQVVLLDFDLPDTTAEQLVPQLRAADPSLLLLLHSSRDDVSGWGERLRTDGALMKSGDWEQVAVMLRALGRRWRGRGGPQ